jgi:hypothetical protein
LDGRKITFMNQNDLVAALRRLPDKEFIETFYESATGRKIYSEPDVQSHLVLANAESHMEDDGTRSPWRIQLLCSTNENWVAESPVCQFGDHCGFETASWAKHSICPICGVEVYGT